MKILTYNSGRTKMIRGLVVTILTWSSLLGLFSAFNYIWQIIAPENYWQVVVVLLVLLVCLVVQSFVNLEQILEVKDRNTFITYYQAGFFKFSQKVYHGPVDVVLEQDNKRYFCVTLKRGGQENFIVDKIPTLKQANERLEEVRAIFI